MSIINFTGFEGSVNNGGIDGLDTPPFSPGTEGSYSTSTKRTGAASARVNKVGSALAAKNIINAINANGTRSNYGGCATMYSTFYIRFATLPASANEEIFRVADDNGYQLSGRITSGGKLQLYGSGGTSQLGSNGATTLTTGVWYKISVKSGSGSSSAAYELYVDGTLELSGTYSATTSPSNVRFHLGAYTDRNSQNMDVFYDDVVCSDSGWPGGDVTKDIEVYAIHPTANGSAMTWSAGTGASDYTQVDEVEYDDADYIMTPSNGTNPNVALFAMQDCATVGITGDILALKAIVVSRENASNSSSHFIRVKSGSTNSDSSNYTDGTTGVVGQGRLLEVDPDTATAWTTAGINAVEVGIVENNNVAVRGINVCAYVLCVPSTAQNYTQELTETVTLVDTITKQTSKPLTDAVTIVDTVIKSTARTLVDVVTLVDTVIKLTSRAFTEAVTLVDTIVKQTTKVLTDVVTLVDVFASARIYLKELLESVTIVDTIVKQTTRVFTETVTLVDTFIKQTTKVLTDTVTAVDTFIKQTARTFTEEITLVDTITKVMSRTFSEVVTLVDTVLKQSQKVLTEAVTLVDTLTRQMSAVRTETITLVDTVIKSITREFTETVTVVDTFIRNLTRTFVETITLNDTIVRQVEKVLTDTITVVDNFLSALFTKAKRGVIILFSRGQDKNVIQSKNKDKTIL